MPTSNSDWVKSRLPDGATFTKNGVTRTVSEAVTDALSDNSGETNTKMLALADLLEIIIADILFKREIDGETTHDTTLLQERADYWRSRAASDAAVASGSFGFVPATFTSANTTDEYSA